MANICENTLINKVRCHREVRYIIRSIEYGEELRLAVCGTCDRLIGRNNLIKAGWSREDAIRWERQPERSFPMNEEDASRRGRRSRSRSRGRKFGLGDTLR